jgi:hypothetical protein
VESPDIGNTKAVVIDLADSLAKCQYAVEQVQMESENLAGTRVGAMMSVMEQSTEAECLLLREHSIHQLRLIPFVKNNDVSSAQLLVQERIQGVVALIEPNVNLGICATELIDGLDRHVLLGRD